ncbi:MAG TPA: hypothetical protein VFU94_08370 [Conexibacter sp.]|nr:hypothetical protein [Conexibacter sp.]
MGVADIEWRGPRPLREGDTLLGRSRELYELCDRCAAYDIVQVTAPSGVGKTSFVSAGGVPELRKAGWHVPSPRPWSDLLKHPALADRRTLGAAAAEILYRLLVGADPEPDGRPLGDVVLGAAEGRRAVVVLDQMEELLRYERALGDALLELAGATARDSPVTHVVVARSEYRERLRPVEVRNARVWNLFLEEITSEKALRGIVEQPARAAGVAIEPAAVELVLRWWTSAREAPVRAYRDDWTRFDALGGVGLLHLQSLLWSFREWAEQRGLDDAIDEQHVRGFAEARAAALDFDVEDEAKLGPRLIEDAIFSYVSDTVARVTAAPTVRTGDEAPRELRWRNGPRLMLARVAPVFSSGGYKVPQAVSSLIPLAFGPELTSAGAQILAQAMRSGADPAVAVDRDVIGAGIAVDWGDREVIAEMVDALHSILQGLSSSGANILRVFDVKDDPVYELVHDGVGAPLARWAAWFSEQPESTIGVIAAQPGSTVRHSLSPAILDAGERSRGAHWGAVAIERDGEHARATVDALKWASTLVGGPVLETPLELRDLELRNCDLTGAALVRCALRDVVFAGGSLRGGVLIDCTLDGVRFAPGPDPIAGRASDAGASGLTINGARSRSTVVFEGLRGTTGLFLNGIAGGEWTLSNCDVRHVAVHATDDVVLRVEHSTVRHLSVSGPVELRPDETSTFAFSELGREDLQPEPR